jgi:alpha-beta hydrolase superfamily lysophospholipase
MRARALALVVVCLAVAPCGAQTRQTIDIRGHEQTLYVYGSPKGDPVIVSSGDGGWIHLGPLVAEFLASRGYYVTGFDVRAYLTSFTSSHSTLRPEDVPGDYRTLALRARGQSGKNPILIGVSEGGGLSVLAAGDPACKSQFAGVIGLGVPEHTELGWRLKDALIYFTHKTPNEPTVSTSEVVAKLAPVPFAAIHATSDEFVSVPEIQNIVNHARDPKRLWIVQAANHRFTDNQAEFERRLLDAIAWIKQNSAQ